MINTAFIDRDLTTPPPGQGAGLLEVPEGLMRASSLETFEAARPLMMVPRSEWRDRAMRLVDQYRDDVTEIYDQGDSGACVGFASAQMLEVMLRRRYGKKHRVSLSGMGQYKRIGRTKDSGSTVDDGMDAVIEGCLPTDSAENKAKYKHTFGRLWSGKLPTGWQETAKLFRGQRFALAKGMDEIASALITGHAMITGRQGHCIPYVFLDFDDKGNPYCAFSNSWRADWGDMGFGYDSERIAKNLTCWVLLDVATRPDLEIPSLA